jgi:hypothetical protein
MENLASWKLKHTAKPQKGHYTPFSSFQEASLRCLATHIILYRRALFIFPKGAFMKKWLTDLDRILRGEATQLSELRGETINVRASRLSVVVVALAVIYGVCMGSYSIFRPGGPSYMQLLATSVKVPLLFFLTLFVTLPSLYVFNALVGSRLRILALFRLLVASLAVNLAVLASLGPIVAFFSLSTTSYHFMVLLNVLVCAASGFLGLAFLLQTLNRMTIALRFQPPMPTQPTTEESRNSQEETVQVQPVDQQGALEPLQGHLLGKQVRSVFNCWVVLFGLVGAQMGWILRPFIGDPNAPFAWFRPRESNFFEAVLRALHSLFS